ncbi:hypothetical protein DEU56DRAFT_915416 [Suillus clintonianus]|uniref:uncharacterized protein n=1 Tax=Suillus clintonianus TaxID=1904413 RepID=UPI001B862DA1|nr:uncharacterized protein DEU56DRAFT_917780 [Suillus clintonianus]XP_041205712.1 uncharacterized protein DEU56DRAFT_915416 [Suillus clintonianus]KAG2122605.1 hypothetical protein DEU56DRAFT_917780 [Suillus clintonianus]KAG2128744.1 hypothetical protein DEU56DRAFT_915416 [Suillus clintonianus]
MTRVAHSPQIGSDNRTQFELWIANRYPRRLLLRGPERHIESGNLRASAPTALFMWRNAWHNA